MEPFKFEIWLGFIWLGMHAWKIESVHGRQAGKLTGTGPPERCEFFFSHGPVLVSLTRVINSTTSRRSSGRDPKPDSPSNLTTEISVSHWFEFWRRKILGLHRITLLPGNLQGRKRLGFIMLSVTPPSDKWLHSIPSPLQSFRLAASDGHFWERTVSQASLSGDNWQWYLWSISRVLPKSLNYKISIVHFTYNHSRPMWLNFRHKKKKPRESTMPMPIHLVSGNKLSSS